MIKHNIVIGQLQNPPQRNTVHVFTFPLINKPEI